MRDSRQAASPSITSDTSPWPVAAQQAGRDRRARAGRAVHHDRGAGRNLGQPAGQFGERDVQGAVAGARGALAGVAHVQYDRRPVPAERLAQVACRQAARLVHLAQPASRSRPRPAVAQSRQPDLDKPRRARREPGVKRDCWPRLYGRQQPWRRRVAGSGAMPLTGGWRFRRTVGADQPVSPSMSGKEDVPYFAGGVEDQYVPGGRVGPPPSQDSVQDQARQPPPRSPPGSGPVPRT